MGNEILKSMEEEEPARLGSVRKKKKVHLRTATSSFHKVYFVSPNPEQPVSRAEDSADSLL